MIKPFPSPITTERLLIRTPEAGDAEALLAAVLESWDQLHLWMPWAVTRPTVDDARETCERMARHTAANEDFALFCFDRKTGEFILASGSHPKKPEVPLFEIGYWCRTSRQGKGYVTEAVQSITDTVFDCMGAHRIEIRCDVRNTPSRAVAERCGYRLEAEFRNDCRDTFGQLRSTYVFARTRD